MTADEALFIWCVVAVVLYDFLFVRPKRGN